MVIKDLSGNRRISITDNTLWKKIDMSIFAYFSKNNNEPSTYREIARAYVSASYSNYQKACENLVNLGYLEKLENGSFKVNEISWGMVKTGKETITRSLPFVKTFLKKLKQRKKL